MQQPDAAPPANPRGRKKLEPDPQVRTAILAAAAEIVRDDGVGALSIAQVLHRAELSTRAFYRHFGSKDQLVGALFLEMARIEMRRLRQLMAAAADPVRAVAAWIDGRLDLALDDCGQIRSPQDVAGGAVADARRPGTGRTRLRRDPAPARRATSSAEGISESFADIDPGEEALSIQGVVWSNIEQQWSAPCRDMAELRTRVQRFCLRGLGVAPETIAGVLADGLCSELLTHTT